MEKNRLISMTYFVLEKYKSFNTDNDTVLYKIVDYAKFLKQPLELWMFVPVDKEGNVLEEPKFPHLGSENQDEYIKHYDSKSKQYQQAKERCLFEGFEKIDWTSMSGFEISNGEIQVCFYKEKPDYFVLNYKTIEALVKYNLQLTPAALKQIGL